MVTRDSLKSGVNLPLIGTVSVAGIGIIGLAAFLLLRKRKRVTSITTRFGK